jgi:sporulation protein YlmC with PRC-barrel domain
MNEMEIPIGAEVHSVEGFYGHSTFIILDPLKNKVTHLAVKEAEYPGTQRLVPVHLIQTTTAQRINLRCTNQELSQMENFIENEFIPTGYEAGAVMMWPFVVPEAAFVTMQKEKMPPGELAVRRGTRVQSTDGDVGRVDEIMVDSQDGKITHLILREGHLFGHRDVAIPVSQIDHLAEETIHLKLNKKGVEDLPEIKIDRRHLIERQIKP